LQGNRAIDGWKYGGSTSIYENYLRLTPDRQSKRGHVWNSNKVQTDSWSATIKFRISGQGKKLFGDGLAFWFTTQSFYRDGELHGFTDMFTGFGIVFDTYVNKEPGHVHKDILFLGSDGSTSKKSAGEHGGGTEVNPTGCNSDFR
jgi:mannose-binding lectin 2